MTKLLLATGWVALACTPAEPPAASDEGSTGATTAPAGSTSAAPGSTSAALGSTGEPDGSGSTAVGTDEGPGPGTTGQASTGTTTGEASTGASSDGTTGPDPGLGVLSGDCGLIDAMELDSASPFTFQGAIDFGMVGFDYDMLTPDGQAVFDAGNLGGSSLHSEVIAFEVLARCEGADLLATEGEIVYTDPMGIKTDILVQIDGRVVGVSVTRAVGFPFDAPYTEAQAADLLTGKLEDILASTANVAPRDAWVKQILHVIAYADMHAQSILAAYATLPPEITADTILVVTVTDGDDAFIY
jgi:hypothetical protein